MILIVVIAVILGIVLLYVGGGIYEQMQDKEEDKSKPNN